MQDRFYFGTNTKMFKTAAETVDYLRRLEELTHGIPPERAQRFVIPSYTSLGPARQSLTARARESSSAPRTWAGRSAGSIPARSPRSCCGRRARGW
ncbi:MAG: hypothetical protein ACLVL7_05945 [Anaerotruncus massiliensis (ex Togo et al. 2019)]